MNDYETKERQAWIKAQGREIRPTFGLLHRTYSPHGDASVDQEYQRRAHEAWARTRSIGRTV